MADFPQPEQISQKLIKKKYALLFSLFKYFFVDSMKAKVKSLMLCELLNGYLHYHRKPNACIY